MAHIKTNKLENGNYEVFGFTFKPEFNEKKTYLDAYLQPDDTYEYVEKTVEAGTKFRARLNGVGRKQVWVFGNVENGELHVTAFSGKGWCTGRVSTKEELLHFIE